MVLVNFLNMIEKKIWGKTPDGKDIIRYTIINASGAKISLSNYGAGIISICVPDKEGVITDVALGYADAESYIFDGPCMGKIPGRYANRIAKGKFSLDGNEYTLAINNGPNHLHGGPGTDCYANRIWSSWTEAGSVTFALDSPDMDAGYPGNLLVEAKYTWSEDNVLSLLIKAKSDKTTVVNLTNHAYFNLKGEGCGDIKEHLLKIYASKYLPTDPTLIPTGELTSVEKTPMDFTSERKIGEGISAEFPAIKYGKGYDNCWAVDGWNKGELKKVAELSEETSGIKLTVHTDQPGIQIYTGNWLSGTPISKSGKKYVDYDGVALECQAFPDSPNRSEFPFTPLTADEIYENEIVFEFGLK